MRLSNKIIYRFTQLAIGMAFVFGLFNSLVISAYIIHPFKPFIQTGDETVAGFEDYWKGIPIKANAATVVPDSSFNVNLQYGNGSTGTAHLSSSYHEIFPHNLNSQAEGNPKIVGGDTVTATFYTNGLASDPLIKAAAITEMTFYLWPQTIGKRFLFFLPQLLLWMLVAFCAWQILILMRDAINGLAFRRRISRRLAMIGNAIILVEIALALLGEFLPYPNSVNVSFHSSIPNNHIPIDLSGFPSGSFSLQWLVTGFMILLLAKVLREGDELQQEQDLMI